MIVVDQLGVELVGLAFEEPVVAVEAALARPLVVRAGGRRILHAAQVPFAEGEGGVAPVAENLGHRGRMIGDVATHMGIATVEIGDGAHADGVVVTAGEQGGAGRGAQRCHVKVGVAQPGRCQPVDSRCDQVRAIASEVGEPGVVEEDEHNVGGSGPGWAGVGHHGVDSAWVRPITPSKRVVGVHGGPRAVCLGAAHSHMAQGVTILVLTAQAILGIAGRWAGGDWNQRPHRPRPARSRQKRRLDRGETLSRTTPKLRRSSTGTLGNVRNPPPDRRQYGEFPTGLQLRVAIGPRARALPRPIRIGKFDQIIVYSR